MIYKFRAWNGKKMINPDYINRGGVAHWKENSVNETSKEIMLFSGLQDMDNQDIYEGDIIKIEYGIGEVLFKAGCFMISWLDDKEANMELLGMYHKSHQFGKPREDVKIISNIYENKNKQY